MDIDIDAITSSVKTAIGHWLIGLVIGVAAQMADITKGMFDTVSNAFSTAFGGATSALTPISTEVVDVITTLQSAVLDFAALAGPLEPVVLIVVVVGLMVIAVRALRALYPLVDGLLDAIPVVGPVLTGLIGSARAFLGGGS